MTTLRNLGSRLAMVTSILVAGALAFGSSAMAAASPEPSGAPAETTWTLSPATADGPDDRVSLRYVLEGGAEADDHVAITNFSDREATFAVYPGDGIVTADGNFDLLPPGEEPVHGGSWIEVSPVDGSSPREAGGVIVDVPAGGITVLPVQIRVPASATPGDHPAGIVAELVRGGDDGVQLASRVGVRVHLRVDGDIVSELAVEDVRASYAPSWNPFGQGSVRVDYTVTNAGNVRLGAETTASIAGPWGVASSQEEASQREIFPGESVSESLEVPVAPLFRAWGDVVATPTVVGEDDVATALTAGSASFTVWTIPWAQLVLLGALIAGFFAIRWWRRRSAARIQARIDAAVAAAAAKSAGEEQEPGLDEPDGEPVRGEQSAPEGGKNRSRG